jgi:hypothetical protein
MPKLHYILAVICYLSIPVAVVCGVALFVLIDPEMARGHINYTRDYQWLERARVAVLGAAVSLACLLWVGCCYLVLKARQRSLRWLPLAAAALGSASSPRSRTDRRRQATVISTSSEA